MTTKSDTSTRKVSNSGTLPEGWRIVQFGDVVRDVNESERNPLDAGLERYIGLDHFQPENLHIKEWGSLRQDEVSFTKRFRKGQVLFVKRRAYQRKVAVAEFDGICSGDVLTLAPKDDMLLPELLPFVLQTDAFFDHVLGTSSGSLSPRTRWSQLKDFEFALPPRETQHRIADMLWAVSEVKQRRLDLACSLQTLFDSLAAKHFRHLRDKACPPTWERLHLGQLFQQRKETGLTEPEILSVTIAGDVVLRDSLERNVVDRTGTEKYYRVLPGDIVYNTMRMWQGSCGVVPTEGLVSPAYTVLNPTERAGSTIYWNLAFHSPWMLDVFTRFSVGVASDRWRLYFRDFSKLWINVPPESERQHVETQLQAIKQRLSECEQQIEQDQELMRALTRHLFSGKDL